MSLSSTLPPGAESSSPYAGHGLSRRTVIGGAAAALKLLNMPGIRWDASGRTTRQREYEGEGQPLILD